MSAERNGRDRRYFSVFFIMLVGTLIGMLVGGRVGSTAQKTYEKLDLFSDILAQIQNTYVDEVEAEALLYGAISGMLTTLDPHSSFLPPDMYKEMQVDTSGQFGGLGIEITMQKGVLTIISPIEDTPASRAGLEPDDSIIAIEGESTEDMSLMDAVKIMRGPTGTKVTLTILREGTNEPKEYTLEREIIKVKSVRSKRLRDNIGYVRISQFQERTGEDLKKALRKLEKKGIQGLVIDMRNNPGGLLDQAIEVSDEFVDDGLIVYTKGRIPNSRQEFRASNEDYNRRYPIVVLINGGSASASEIVAGALQDHGRALVMGTTSFGKGSVQTIIPQRDGSALRLTTAKYYTPNGRSIQATGIEPDILVEQSLIGDVVQSGMRFREKDLEGHFEHELLGAEATDEAEPNAKSKTEGEKKDGADRKLTPDEQDYQLQRALDLLKGYTIFNQTSLESASK